ncbi:MAG: PorT family protein [Bacteroidales bacterium]|nr:PorT family protein [Bacteroidales bacterium]MBR5028861.1 PorT family protein [Bacteroidales bacterium]
MKKTLKIMTVAAVLMFATSSSLMAQFKFGVKASGTLNNMFWSEDTATYMERHPVFGFNVGVMGEYFLGDNMSIGAELMFAQQGFRRTSEYNETSEYGKYHSENDLTFRTNHVNLPIVFRYYINGLAIEAGPQLSFCFGGKIKQIFSDEYTYGGVTETNSRDTTYYLADVEKEEQHQLEKEGLKDFKFWNRINVGGTVGLSYNMENGLFFGARYTYDFTNLLNDYEYKNDKPVKTDMKSNYGVLSVSVGFKF